MELKQLRYFLAVAESLNFSRAAESLYISQPALSYQIAELERELGTELFARDRRRVFLTPGGQALLEPVREILKQAEQLPKLAQQGPVEKEGVLRVGFDDTEDHFELIGVTQILADFARKNPGVQLEVKRQSFTDCADQVIYDDLDVAFLLLRYKENLPPQLTSRPVFRSRLIMAVSQDSPALTCQEAIREHELLLVEEKPRGNSRILKVLDDMKLNPRVRHVDSITSAFVHTQIGTGVMLMSETYFDHHSYPGLRRIDLELEEAHIAHEVVWNRGTQNPNVHKLLDMLPHI